MKSCARAALDVAATATTLEATVIGCRSSHDHSELMAPGPVNGGAVVSGTSPDGSKSVTVLLFTEGEQFSGYEITSDPRDPVPMDFLVPVGQKQGARIKAFNVS